MKSAELAGAIAEAIRGVVGPLRQRIDALEAARDRAIVLQEDVTKAIDLYRADVAELAGRPPIPGPPGPPGPAGADGKDGTPGLRYLGVYVGRKTYDAGDVVTFAGSAWHCQRTTTAAPGPSADWILMVKRGRDAKPPKL